jgi:hypothetical protein
MLGGTTVAPDMLALDLPAYVGANGVGGLEIFNLILTLL